MVPEKAKMVGWKKLEKNIFSDESKIMIGHDKRVYCGGKRAKVGDLISLTTDHGQGLKLWYGGVFLGSVLLQ